MHKLKHKKIYYIPGTISLILLPILFIIFSNKEIKRRTIGVFPLFLIDTNRIKMNSDPEYVKYFTPFLPKRNYIDINITGDKEKDEIKLGFAQLKIRDIISHNNYTNGVHFTFGDSSEYWSLIKAIDILRFEKAKSYLLIDNDLWFFQLQPDTTHITIQLTYL